MLNQNAETIIATATPKGKGALAIARLSGPKAKKIACKVVNKKFFQQKRELHWLYDCQGLKFDQALLNIFEAPHSFTGEETVEFYTHGSNLIQQKLIETCLFYGARPAAPGEFTQRAFLNGKLDLQQAESIMDLIQAKSQKLLNASCNQLAGDLKTEINFLKNNLTEILGLIHGPLDFPLESESAEIDYAQIEEILMRSQAKTKNLIKISEHYNIFRSGARLAILGLPNAGKSSLLNFLLAEERAIVSDHPGTTRDFLSEEILVKDIPLEIIDTAGLREEPDNKIEEIGIQKALKIAAQAELILFVFDQQFGWTPENQAFYEALPNTDKIILVANKVDLLNAGKANPASLPAQDLVKVSCLNKSGLADLEEAIAERFNVNEELDFNLCLNQRQLAIFQQISNCLEQMQPSQVAPELISVKCEEALNLLEHLQGKAKFLSDQSLQAIFSNFCIGK
jgi:tRNA modification GTPase